MFSHNHFLFILPANSDSIQSVETIGSSICHLLRKLRFSNFTFHFLKIVITIKIIIHLVGQNPANCIANHFPFFSSSNKHIIAMTAIIANKITSKSPTKRYLIKPHQFSPSTYIQILHSCRSFLTLFRTLSQLDCCEISKPFTRWEKFLDVVSFRVVLLNVNAEEMAGARGFY